MTGISTGWKYLDKYLGGWNKGNMVVIAGRPGSGKTAIALSLAIDCCRHAKALFISLEMSKEELAKRYLSFIANVENYKIRSARVTEMDLKEITDRLYGMNMDFFLDDGSNSDINDIVAKIKLHKAKHGLDIVFIDYMQLIKSHQKVREQEIAHISRTLKLLAKELGITLVALAQLSRETEKRALELANRTTTVSPAPTTPSTPSFGATTPTFASAPAPSPFAPAVVTGFGGKAAPVQPPQPEL